MTKRNQKLKAYTFQVEIKQIQITKQSLIKFSTEKILVCLLIVTVAIRNITQNPQNKKVKLLECKPSRSTYKTRISEK